MPIERATGHASLIDVLDRVLDKGIMIDSWARVSFAGIDLMTVEVRAVVTSIDTYFRYSSGGPSGTRTNLRLDRERSLVGRAGIEPATP